MTIKATEANLLALHEGICSGVSNGDVEVRLSYIDELPYVIGLVRQALEKQLGSDGDA